MKNSYRIRPYAHERLKWVVRGKENGKWVRKFFEKKFEAETFAQFKNTELSNQGTEGASFPTALRVMAQREQDRLQPYKKTLTDAVDYYLKHLEATTRSVSIQQAMMELIANRKSIGVSKQYCADLHWRISRFIKSFPNHTVAGITTQDIDDWLGRLGVAPVTRNTFRRDLRTLFSFCVTRKYCPENPATKTSRAKEIDGTIEILTVTETARLLEAATPEWIPYLAIGAFAGLRPSEIARLDWAEIDLESSLIEVKAQKSKTARRRLVKILPNLRAWLQPLAKHDGPIVQGDLRWDLVEIRERAGLSEWPTNALRHSFASYHLAHFNDAAALALQMGHTNSTMIFNHYREVVKPKEAARYWNIKPSQRSKKVLEFMTA